MRYPFMQPFGQEVPRLDVTEMRTTQLIAHTVNQSLLTRYAAAVETERGNPWNEDPTYQYLWLHDPEGQEMLSVTVTTEHDGSVSGTDLRLNRLGSFIVGVTEMYQYYAALKAEPERAFVMRFDSEDVPRTRIESAGSAGNGMIESGPDEVIMRRTLDEKHGPYALFYGLDGRPHRNMGVVRLPEMLGLRDYIKAKVAANAYEPLPEHMALLYTNDTHGGS